jgi:hypothetical protein
VAVFKFITESSVLCSRTISTRTSVAHLRVLLGQRRPRAPTQAGTTGSLSNLPVEALACELVPSESGARRVRETLSPQAAKPWHGPGCRLCVLQGEVAEIGDHASLMARRDGK